MDPRDVIYFTEHRIQTLLRQREQERLVDLAKGSPVRGPRIFRFLPSSWFESDSKSG